jgi:integrase
MRRSELIGLRWADVDIRRRVARLNDTKNGESREVPLSTRAKAALEALQPHARDSKTRVVGWIHPDVVTWEFAQACKSCGIVGLRWHDLRHEATSRLFERGLALAEVAAVTGHRSWAMLRRYTHLRSESLVDKLG